MARTSNSNRPAGGRGEGGSADAQLHVLLREFFDDVAGVGKGPGKAVEFGKAQGIPVTDGGTNRTVRAGGWSIQVCGTEIRAVGFHASGGPGLSLGDSLLARQELWRRGRLLPELA